MPPQLTFLEREKISQMRYSKASSGEIALALGRAKSTISRELRRNSLSGVYLAVKAQEASQKRRRERSIERKMDRSAINQQVRMGIAKYWSPEQVSGRMRQAGTEPNATVSRSTIERWIRKDEHRQHWESFLRRRGKRRPKEDRRGQLPATTPISGRPPVVDERSRCGDWEGDTIVSPGKRSGLVSSTDRRSGLLMLNRVSSLKSATVIAKMREQRRDLPADRRFTMTRDNGKEFAQHARLTNLLPEGVYFARPAHPWERGSNENTNGLIRQFVPKRTDIASVSSQRVKQIQNLLNERPRKRLGYQTPNEVFAQENTKPRCI